MSRKSKQHIVPRTYLRNWCDPLPPAGWPAEKRFTPAVWVHPRTLDTPPHRAAPKNVAWARDVYTLRNDDPDHPWLEEALGKLEHHFAPTIRRVQDGTALTERDAVVLGLFVGALHERTLGMLQQRQDFLNQLAHLTQQFESNHEQIAANPQLKASRDKFWQSFGDEGKRQLANFAAGFAKAAAPHAMILENESPMDLITSDSPVSYRQVHSDELLRAGLPKEWLFQEIPRSAREFFIFCPLTPRHALVSSPFFPPNGDMPRRSTAYQGLILVLNELTRSSADEELYATSAEPYGLFTRVARAHDRRLTAARANPPSGLLVYSRRERYWLPTTTVHHGNGDHPLTSRLTFRTADLSTLREMANDNDFSEITIIDGGREMGGMRGAWFVSVAIDAHGESIIEHGIARQG